MQFNSTAAPSALKVPRILCCCANMDGSVTVIHPSIDYKCNAKSWCCCVTGAAAERITLTGKGVASKAAGIALALRLQICKQSDCI